MRYITDTNVVSPEATVHGMLCMFLGMWEEHIADYDIEIRPGSVWGQVIHSTREYDWDLSEALANLEVALAQHPFTAGISVDLSVLPFFIPRGVEP